MKAIKRNKVKVDKKGNYLMIGLNKNEKESLKATRQHLSKNISASIVDQYIIALYDYKSNEVFFADESSYCNNERAVLI